MPPHLHPRSRLTSSLFLTTLFASFFVVVLPHALPCPAPRIALADEVVVGEDGRRRRRKRKSVEGAEETTEANVVKTEIFKPEIAGEEDMDDISQQAKERRLRRECPLPKPGGKMGELLGFKTSTGSIADGPNTSRPP